MSTKYKARDPDHAYFITLTIVNWIHLFNLCYPIALICASLKYCQQKKGLEIYAYCIMPSHIHLLCRAGGDIELSDILRDFKKYTARRIVKHLKANPGRRNSWILQCFSEACEHLKRPQSFKVWQTGYHAIAIYSTSFIQQKLIYIHNNPVVAELVEKPEDYRYSSARNYSGKTSALEVIPVLFYG